MLYNSKLINSEDPIQGDICIIGAGPAGISMALELESFGKNVILVESGDFSYNSNFQALNDGFVSGVNYFPLQSTRVRMFGGTGQIWGGMCSPLDTVDFEERHWVPHSGWPIKKMDLDPYYNKAHYYLGLEEICYEFEFWKNKLTDVTTFSFFDQTFYNKMWQYSTIKFKDRYKSSIVNSQKIIHINRSTFSKFIFDDNISSTKSAVFITKNSKTFYVNCKYYVLACGGIENARILLNSHPKINENDLVGRFFMEHIEIPIGDLHFFNKHNFKLYTWTYGKTKASAEIAMSSEFQRLHSILNGTISLEPLILSQMRKSKSETWKYKDPFRSRMNAFENWSKASMFYENNTMLESKFRLNLRLEQSPNPNSRITLSNSSDYFGVAKPILHWELTDLEKRSILTIIRLFSQKVGANNLGRIKVKEFIEDLSPYFNWPKETSGGFHHMGTTRMSLNSSEGVVDLNCKLFHIDNLYVSGSSVFSTSGAPNPTLTIIALALRLAEHLKELAKGK